MQEVDLICRELERCTAAPLPEIPTSARLNSSLRIGLKTQRQEKKIHTMSYLEGFVPEAAFRPSEELQCRSWATANQRNLS